MNNLFSLNDKVVVVTGGSGFLGSQYCSALRDAGASVINWDLDTGVDISDPESIKKAVTGLKKVDVLINNAALNFQADDISAKSCWSPYEEFPRDLWENEIRINLTAQMDVTQAIAPLMMRQLSGSIIFVASDLALIGPHNDIYESGQFKDIAYITSKAGVLGLMRSWAAYLGPHNVRVNAFVPGGVYRNHTQEFAIKNGSLNMLGRMANHNEYNGPIIFLASEASSYMTGSCLVVDGGRTAW